MANANLNAMVREYWKGTIVNQVYQSIPLFARMLERGRIRLRGSSLKFTVQKANMDSLGQAYDPDTTPMTAGSKTLWTTASFDWKFHQLPVEYTAKEKLFADSGTAESPNGELVMKLGDAATYGMRLHLYKRLYSSVDTANYGVDANSMTGLIDALDHDHSYGGLTRSTTATNGWWQGASKDGTYTDQNTAVVASIANFRDIRSVVQQYIRNGSDLLAIMGSDIFNRFRAEVEASAFMPKQSGPLAQYGFQSIMVDGVEFVEDPYLNTNPHSGSTSGGYYTPEWFFLLNIPTWTFYIHPERAMTLTDYVWQGDQANGMDKWLARILFTGQLVCEQPNSNYWSSYMTA